MGGFPPFLWSTRGRRQEDPQRGRGRQEDPQAKLVRLYAEAAVAIEDLYLGLGVEEARCLTPRPPPTQQQQEQPLVSDAAWKAVIIFCRGFIIVVAIVLMAYIFMMTSFSPTRPEQLNPYQAAALVAVGLLVTGFAYTVLKLEEIATAS